MAITDLLFIIHEYTQDREHDERRARAVQPGRRGEGPQGATEHPYTYVCMCVCMCIYIYIYI